MAKKRPSSNNSQPARETASKPHASEVRIQTFEVAQIKETLEDARQWIAAIAGTLELCEQHKIDQVTIDGAMKLLKSLQLMESFAGHLYKGANRAITEQRRAQREGQAG